MTNKTYEVGDTVWIHNGGDENPLERGVIVHTFLLDGWIARQYVIEIQTGMDPDLEVRDTYCISNTAEGPINLWKRS